MIDGIGSHCNIHRSKQQQQPKKSFCFSLNQYSDIFYQLNGFLFSFSVIYSFFAQSFGLNSFVESLDEILKIDTF
jgi:hypothetical protein